MSKNIKHSSLKLIGGAIQAYGAYSQKGKTQGEEARAQGEYRFHWGRFIYFHGFRRYHIKR